MTPYDYAVVGGGIVGLATGLALTARYPSARLLILEKETSWGVHQTGHNSGVIHSGVYYKPGSLKAALCREGNRAMVEFCRTHGIPHDVCGKVVVATGEEELPLMRTLLERGKANGIAVREITAAELREIEPHVRGIAGLHVPSTGIVSYLDVVAMMAQLLSARGAELRPSAGVTRVADRPSGIVLETGRGEFETKFLINCGGLQSDRVAKMAGVKPGMKIIPFRGEYYELKPERRSLVKNLVYPVPNPDFPFLGVHFTRMIDGGVHAGPNAVLGLKREAYRKTDFSLRDTVEVLTYPGFWTLARKNYREGMKEMVRSFSKGAFVRSLQRLIPEVTGEDLQPAHAGVRAQALMHDGTLMDDFVILRSTRSLHVCNAPSPAATASLKIGEAIVEKLTEP